MVSGAVDTEVTAVFGADGQLSGSAGCNTYNAPYTVSGTNLQVGPVGGNAHTADEYIDVGSAVAFVRTLALFITRWCGVAD